MPKPARRRLAVAALVLLVPALGACGFNYQTDQVYQPGVGSDSRDGVVEVLGAVIVSSSEGNGTFVASLVNSANEDADQLTTLTAQGAQASLAGPVDLDPDSLVNLAEDGGVRITGDRVKEGNFVRVQMQFKSGQKTSLNVPVVPNEAPFDDVRPAPSSTPTS
jgi:hypothetical protein